MIKMFEKISNINSHIIDDLENIIKIFVLKHSTIFSDKFHMEIDEVDSFYEEMEIKFLDEVQKKYKVIGVKFYYNNYNSNLSNMHLFFNLDCCNVEIHFNFIKRVVKYSDITLWSCDFLCGVEFSKTELTFKFIDKKEKAYSSTVFRSSGFSGYVVCCEFLNNFNIFKNLDKIPQSRIDEIERFENFIYSTRMLDLKNLSFNSLNFITGVIKNDDSIENLIDFVSLNYDINMDIKNCVFPIGFNINDFTYNVLNIEKS